MKRELVTPQELVTRMNAELHGRGIPEAVAFRGSVYRYRSPDEAGVNWSDQVTLGGSGVSPRFYIPEAAGVVVWARERFNLAPAGEG
jgi:hypothetical protein